MFTKFRNHFGIPGLIAVAALVFAMIGGAYAANNSGGGGKATASAKGKKGPRGPRGPKGAPGAPGAQGPAGPAGPAGAKGDKGDAGANGAAGATGPIGPTGATGKDGQSVTNTPVPPGTPVLCDELGGAEFKVGSGAPTFACNGEQGEDGEEGKPWTPDNTLPPGATLTGTWSFNATDDNIGALALPEAYVTLEFPIKLAEQLPESRIHIQGEAGFATNCPGNEVENPKALEGHLCIFKGFLEGATLAIVTDLNFSFTKQTNVNGALLQFEITGESAFGFGSWAVTGFDDLP